MPPPVKKGQKARLTRATVGRATSCMGQMTLREPEPVRQFGCSSGTVEDRPPQEAELVVRAKRGEPNAYEEIVRMHQTIAFRTAWVITRSDADAEEAAQDAFVKAHAALGRFREGAPFRPWLLAIVANEARQPPALRRPPRRARAARGRGAPPGRRGPVARGGAPRLRAARAAPGRDRAAAGSGPRGDRLPLSARALGGGDGRGARLPARDRQVAHLACARPAAVGAR